jgi:hypothetical protein
MHRTKKEAEVAQLPQDAAATGDAGPMAPAGEAQGLVTGRVEPSIGSKAVWAGRVLSGLVTAFMLGASITPKLFFPELAAESMQQLGWPQRHLLLVGAIELVGTVLYTLPRTNVLGAVFMTGLLGGATAAHLRVGNPLLTHVLFAVLLGTSMWAALWLRHPSLRAVLPLRRTR